MILSKNQYLNVSVKGIHETSAATVLKGEAMQWRDKRGREGDVPSGEGARISKGTAKERSRTWRREKEG
jgi:hypothetical protein